MTNNIKKKLLTASLAASLLPSSGKPTKKKVGGVQPLDVLMKRSCVEQLYVALGFTAVEDAGAITVGLGACVEPEVDEKGAQVIRSCARQPDRSSPTAAAVHARTPGGSASAGSVAGAEILPGDQDSELGGVLL
jgi:hypothetical protein